MGSQQQIFSKSNQTKNNAKSKPTISPCYGIITKNIKNTIYNEYFINFYGTSNYPKLRY